MAYADILAKVKAKLVAGVGATPKVYDYDRYVTDWAKFLSLFKTTGDKIHGWTVEGSSAPGRRVNVATVEREHTFVMRGYYGLQDAEASGKTFRGIAEAGQNAFDQAGQLDGTVLKSEPADLVVFQIRKFGSVLCHYAEIHFRCTERKIYNP